MDANTRNFETELYTPVQNTDSEVERTIEVPEKGFAETAGSGVQYQPP